MHPMIKTIIVLATGSDADAGVFTSALAVARPFCAHLGFLHVRVDAAAFGATIMPEVSSPQLVTGLINRMDEEAEQREQRAKQLFESFCRREGLACAETSRGPLASSARWLREIGFRFVLARGIRTYCRSLGHWTTPWQPESSIGYARGGSDQQRSPFVDTPFGTHIRSARYRRHCVEVDAGSRPCRYRGNAVPVDR
jgi:hypothetical protein